MNKRSVIDKKLMVVDNIIKMIYAVNELTKSQARDLKEKELMMERL